MNISYSSNDEIETTEVVDLYTANNWSSAKKPDALIAALRNSHSLITARFESQLVGLGNALSDGHLVVYYPHLIVHPDYQRQGIGRAIMQRMSKKYGQLHQQMLVADGAAMAFYKSMGFQPAGHTQSMWIYQGDEH